MKKEVLETLGFVRLDRGKVMLGTEEPCPCGLEGTRKSEIPLREILVKGFWINRYCVTNVEFEQFKSKHVRCSTSPDDKSPVVDVTYLDAAKYCEYLSHKYGLSFSLPTEPEWALAAAPFGWGNVHAPDHAPTKGKAHSFNLNVRHSLNVDDNRFGENVYGLLHIAGNVHEITKGWYYAQGHYGALVDGAYYIAKGGGFAHCSYGTRVSTRFIVDVAERSTRIGFRVASSGGTTTKI